MRSDDYSAFNLLWRSEWFFRTRNRKESFPPRFNASRRIWPFLIGCPELECKQRQIFPMSYRLRAFSLLSRGRTESAGRQFWTVNPRTSVTNIHFDTIYHFLSKKYWLHFVNMSYSPFHPKNLLALTEMECTAICKWDFWEIPYQIYSDGICICCITLEPKHHNFSFRCTLACLWGLFVS